MTAPLHGKAAEFRRLGLFSGIKSFSELERRIEALADEKLKGDALEVFAEAYLATQRVGMAKHVWPDKMIPSSIRKRLRLSARDVGADGVIETVSGKCRAYQVKFRSRRAPLTWTDTAPRSAEALGPSRTGGSAGLHPQPRRTDSEKSRRDD